jgi:hypothetical protein
MSNCTENQTLSLSLSLLQVNALDTLQHILYFQDCYYFYSSVSTYAKILMHCQPPDPKLQNQIYAKYLKIEIYL